MHDLKSSKVDPRVHCLSLRHKGMYVTSVPYPDESKFYDTAYDSTAYWCGETQTGFGPDGQPVRPDVCQSQRGCCQH